MSPVRLLESEAKGLIDVVRDLGSLPHTDDFRGHLAPALGRVVGFHGINVCELDGRTSAIVRVWRPPGAGWADRLDALANAHWSEHPLPVRHRRVGSAPIKVSDFVGARRWKSTTLYNVYFRQFGEEDQFAFPLVKVNGRVRYFVVSRDVRSFTERDRAKLALLGPHLSRAYGDALGRQEAQRRLAALERAAVAARKGVMLVGSSDEPVPLTEPVHEQLAYFFADGSPGDGLPRVVTEWLGECRRAIRFGVAATPLVVRREHRALTMSFLTRSAPHEADVILLDEASGPRSAAVEAAPELAPRDVEVIRLVARGRSNDQIARQLHITPRAVRHHLTSIYARLGVASRSEAVARVFPELATGSGRGTDRDRRNCVLPSASG